MMAMQFNTIFGDMLATENLCEGNTLPSPEQLKYKVILKGRAPQSKPKKPTKGSTLGSRFTKKQRASTKPPQYNSVSEEPVIGGANNQQKLSLTRLPSGDSQDSQYSQYSEEDEEEEDLLVFGDKQEGTTEDEQVSFVTAMGSLIVYCKSVPYKRSKVSLDCCEMHSFHENVALQLLESRPRDIIMLSQRKFLR